MTEQTSPYRAKFKYQEKKAREYQRRQETKHRAEMRMVDRAFALIPKTHHVLDVPCGGGRITIHLAQQGYTVSAADLSESMISITRENIAKENLNCTVERQNIEKLTLADRAVDSIISFRLFHHFPTPDIRQRAVRELCRVARKYVALSYFSPLSVTSVKRRMREARGGRKSEKFSTPLFEVESYFEKAGFRLVKDFARMPFIHTMHLALFERAGETKP